MNQKVMTYQTQDNLLLKDILNRNYFLDFKSLKNIKSFNLTFFFNDKYSNVKYIPIYESLEKKNNIENILLNWDKFLNWYKENNFYTDLIIHDELLINDLNNFKRILDHLLNKEIVYKRCIINVDLNQLNSIYEFKDFIDFYTAKGIKFKFNVPINLIDQISYINNIDEIQIIIPPSLSSDELIKQYNKIKNSNLNIINIIEEDSENWKEKDINEYLKFILFLLQNINSYDELFNEYSLISLSDKHIIDNTKCKKDCCFQNSLNILLSDFSINLCHKFQYDDQVIGYFEFDNETNELTTKAKILPLIMFNTHFKRSSAPHCETCPFINLCKGYCFANSYDRCFNPAIPIRESCNLKKSKFTFILQTLATDKNFVDFIASNKNFSEIYKSNLFTLLDMVKGA